MGWKDSVANVAATGEFVWNLVTRPLAEAMNATAAEVAPGVDEFALAGLATEPSRLVKPPRVADSPVAFECRLTQLVRLETKEGRELDQWLVIGEAVGIHIDRRCWSTAATRRCSRNRSRAAAVLRIISR